MMKNNNTDVKITSTFDPCLYGPDFGHHFDVYLYVSSLKNFHIFNLLFSAF